MLNIKRILVASDMSESSALAETRAAALCVQLGLPELELVHVQDTGFTDMLGQILGGSSQKSEELVIEQVTKDFEPLRERISDEFGINTTLTILFGRPSNEIARYANESAASLIVVGAKQPGTGRKFFLGNTPDRLLHATSIPLLIVRQAPVNPYQDVLIPVDFSENATFAAKVGIRMLLPASKKTFLHAYHIPNEGLMRYASVSAELINSFRVKAKEQAEEDMANLIALLGTNGRVSQVVQYGNALHVIEDYVNANNPDLIIMGKEGRSRLGNLLLGSIARNTVNETSCDILIVPLKPATDAAS